MPQFDTFFGRSDVQAVTVLICLAILFLVAPVIQQKVRLKLNVRQRELFDPIAKDILVQVWVLFGGVAIYSMVALIRSDVSFVLGDALPFVCLLGAISAFWNIRRSDLLLRQVTPGSNEQRAVRLADVKERSLTAYTAGIVSFGYGLPIVFAVLLLPEQLPNWLWFLSFVVTGTAIYSLVWSISVLAVATEYAQNKKLGRSNPSFHRTCAKNRAGR
ncbi:hypothetical protein FACS1894116_11500 [Betaproteobacteria bacterium]|nr:hypothetical protein FACS1894116_11500 [Betaproteobacteria bacterium]